MLALQAAAAATAAGVAGAAAAGPVAGWLIGACSLTVAPAAGRTAWTLLILGELVSMAAALAKAAPGPVYLAGDIAAGSTAAAAAAWAASPPGSLQEAA